MFLADLFSRFCSARGQFVIVVTNQCVSSGKHVASLGKSTNLQGLVFHFISLSAYEMKFLPPFLFQKIEVYIVLIHNLRI